GSEPAGTVVAQHLVYVNEVDELCGDAGFLQRLAQSRTTRPFAGLDVPAGQAPAALERAPSALHQQQAVGAKDHKARGGARPASSPGGRAAIPASHRASP